MSLRGEVLVAGSSLVQASLRYLFFFALTLAPARLDAAPIPSFPPASDKSLACGQLRWLGLWSLQKFVSDDDLNLLSPAFSRRAAAAFAERLDPYRILVTEGEVRRLRKDAFRSWRAAFLSGDCSRFASWRDRVVAPARERLLERLETIRLDAFAIGDGSEADTPELPKPKRFAKNEAELKARLTHLLDRLFAGATKQVLLAYGNDRTAFARDSLRLVVLTPEPPVAEVLAKSMLKAMDPYSTYLTGPEYADFSDDLAGATSGIGVQVRPVPRGLLIEKVLPDSPAAKTGKIEAGDLITQVDGKKLRELPTEKARDVLRGPEGTKVDLTVERQATSHTLEFRVALTRSRFSFDEGTITHRTVEKGEARLDVIAIPSFYGSGDVVPGLDDKGSSAKDLEKILVKINGSKKRPDVVVLDLRQNPGGYLEEAIAMAGLFLGDRPVVGIVERNNRRVFRNPFTSARYTGPLVVLVDEESASASEVLAGALKDHHRALVLGTPRTYGKGTIQRLFHLEDETLFVAGGPGVTDGVIKLTTSVFYSPLGHSPTGGGLRPHLLLAEGKAESDAERPHVRYATDVTPFLSRQELKRIRDEAPRWTSLLKELEKRRATRATAEAKSAGSDDSDLDEALSIASDYVALAGHRRAPAPVIASEQRKPSVASEAAE